MIQEENSDITELYKKDETAGDESIITLRPGRLSEYVGQDTIVETLQIAIEAALKRAPGNPALNELRMQWTTEGQ